MPIAKHRKALYPPRKEWLKIRETVRQRAGDRCEGCVIYPTCRAVNGQPHPITGSKVVCTTAHLNHNPRDNRLSNLAFLCQRCHLAIDRYIHIRNRQQHVLAASREGESLTLPLEE